MGKIKIELVIEKSSDALWGSVNYNQNLIVDHGNNIIELESQFKVLLQDIENIDPENIEFEFTYNVYALFDEFDFLNITKVAKHAGINPGLLRQYASGVKHPSLLQAKKIEETIHNLAAQMQKASVYAE